MRSGRRLIACLLLAALLGMGAPASGAPAKSVSVAAYSGRVSDAADATEDALSTVGDAAVADGLAARVRELVLEVESVESGGATVEVEHGTLSSLVVRLETAKSGSIRRETASDMLAQLRSQEMAILSADAAPEGDEALLRRLIEEEGAGAPSDSDRRLMDWIQERIEKLFDWLDGVMGTRGAQTSFKAVYYVLLALSVVVMAWVLFSIIRRFRSSSEAGADEPASTGAAVVAAAEGLPDDALAFADGEAGAGRYREAVRALFGGAARELVERGVVPRTRTRTNAELLGDVGSSRPALRAPLASLAGMFEPAWYGHIDPGEDGFRAAREVYVALVTTLAGEAG